METLNNDWETWCKKNMPKHIYNQMKKGQAYKESW